MKSRRQVEHPAGIRHELTVAAKRTARRASARAGEAAKMTFPTAVVEAMNRAPEVRTIGGSSTWRELPPPASHWSYTSENVVRRSGALSC